MSNRTNLNDFFETADISLATAISLWYPLDLIDRTNPSKALFVFKRDSELNKLIESYWKQELRIEPQIYFQALKTIKSRLYGEERRQKR